MQGEAHFCTSSVQHFNEFGFAIIPRVIRASEIEILEEALGPLAGPGRRNLLSEEVVAELMSSQGIRELISSHAGKALRPVRAVYFDKTPSANWAVGWHQDQMIAVRERFDVPGFGPWTIKKGTPHVQPPVAILEEMLAIRIHLDDCDELNGPLKVLPRTHALGRLESTQIETLSQQIEPVACCCAAGGAILMRPLLVHASNRATRPAHRRVLHIEYAGFELPKPLEWNDRA